MRWMLVNPLQCWHLKRLQVFLTIWSNPSCLCASVSSAMLCRYLSLFFLATRAVPLKSPSKGNMLHLSYGRPSKLLLLEMLCAAAKSRALRWHSKRTYHLIKSAPTGREVAVIKHRTLAISDLCNMSATWTKQSCCLTGTSRASERNKIISDARGYKQQLSQTSTP